MSFLSYLRSRRPGRVMLRSFSMTGMDVCLGLVVFCYHVILKSTYIMHVALEAKPPSETPPKKKRLVSPNGTVCPESASSGSLATTEANCSYYHI